MEQRIRWLVRDPELTTMAVTAERASVEPGHPIGVDVVVRKPDYQPAPDAQVTVELVNAEKWPSAEKAIKSIYLRRSRAFPFSHSLTELCQGLRINGRLLQAAAVLDQYYVTGRYPSGAGSLAPFESFRDFQAIEAVDFAVRFLKAATTATKTRKTPPRRTK